MESQRKIYLLFFSFYLTFTFAQQSITSSGGNSFGAGGSSSYSVGQITYLSTSGSNGSINEGIQHPYEIITLGTDMNTDILLLAVYPNPTMASVVLFTDKKSYENIEYHLFDFTGKKLLSQKITQSETQISLKNFNTAIYLLQILEGGKTIKTFKIIKK